MKKQLRVYFDYACPYCYHSIMDLLSLLSNYPGLAVSWIPCEAHPLPESAWVHSCLASQMMLAVDAFGGDLISFHKQLFEACYVKHQRLDDTELLVQAAVLSGMDREKAVIVLKEKRYEQDVKENNFLVWESMGLEAVPCYQSGEKFLKSHEDVIIPKKRLKSFLDIIMEK